VEQRAAEEDSEEDGWEVEGVSFVPVALGSAAPTLPDFLKVSRDGNIARVQTAGALQTSMEH
jgi:hypothetical protein